LIGGDSKFLVEVVEREGLLFSEGWRNEGGIESLDMSYHTIISQFFVLCTFIEPYLPK